MDNEAKIESEIVAKGLSAPRITPQHIDGLMAELRYECWLVPNTTTTICVAVKPDGFTVATGKASSVSAANFDSEIGIKVARSECERLARDKLWELEGYLLKSKLS